MPGLLVKHKWLVLITLAGLALRLAFVLLVPTLPVSDFLNYNNLAVNIVTYGTYGYGTTPMHYLSPGTSFFLALVYGIFQSTDIIYPKLIQVMLGTLDIVLIYYIALKVFGGRAALFAAAIWALFPTPIEYTAILASENPFTFLALLSIALLLAFKPESRLHYAGVFLAAAATGISALVRPAALLLPALFLAFLLFPAIKNPDVKRIVSVTALMAIAVLLTVGPWCARNYVEFGHFSLSSNGGQNLWMGNNEHATGSYMPMGKLIYEKFGNVSGLDSFEMDGLYMKAGIEYALAHPVNTLYMDAFKMKLLYGTSASGVFWSMLSPGVIADPSLQQQYEDMKEMLYKVSNYYYGGVLALAVIGLLFAALRPRGYDKAAAMLLVLYVLYFSAVYAATTAFDRYNVPMLPILAVFCAYGAMGIYDFMDKLMRNGDGQKREA